MQRRLCAAILVFEAIVFGLTTPVLFSVTDASTTAVLLIGPGLAILCLLVAGLLRLRAAYWIGWAHPGRRDRRRVRGARDVLPRRGLPRALGDGVLPRPQDRDRAGGVGADGAVPRRALREPALDLVEQRLQAGTALGLGYVAQRDRRGAARSSRAPPTSTAPRRPRDGRAPSRPTPRARRAPGRGGSRGAGSPRASRPWRAPRRRVAAKATANNPGSARAKST